MSLYLFSPHQAYPHFNTHTHRSGRFSPRKLDEVPITRTESFSEGGDGITGEKTDIL